MDCKQINTKIAAIKADLQEMLVQDSLDPCIRAGLESALAHIDLLYIELGLDIL